MTFDKLKNNSGITVRVKVYYTSPLVIKQSDTKLVDHLRLTPLAITVWYKLCWPTTTYLISYNSLIQILLTNYDLPH